MTDAPVAVAVADQGSHTAVSGAEPDPRRARWVGAVIALLGATALATIVSLPVDAFSHSTDKYVLWLFGMRKLVGGPELFAATFRNGVLVAPVAAWIYAARDFRTNPDSVGLRMGVGTLFFGAYIEAFTYMIGGGLSEVMGSGGDPIVGLFTATMLALVVGLLGVILLGLPLAAIILPLAIVWARVLRWVLTDSRFADLLAGQAARLADSLLGTWRVALIVVPVWILLLYLYLATVPPSLNL